MVSRKGNLNFDILQKNFSCNITRHIDALKRTSVLENAKICLKWPIKLISAKIVVPSCSVFQISWKLTKITEYFHKTLQVWLIFKTLNVRAPFIR